MPKTATTLASNVGIRRVSVASARIAADKLFGLTISPELNK